MKTIKKWLEELPEPYRTKALNNTTQEMLSESADDLLHALSSAFIWAQTPQGGSYWEKVASNLNSILLNPEELKLCRTAELLIDFGMKGYEYLRGDITPKEFADWLESISNTYSLKI